MNYRTPGVYVEEINTLPPSVAQVSTAIPAFVGYTETAPALNTPTRIETFLEFQELFGGPQYGRYLVDINADGTEINSLTVDVAPAYHLYYAMDMYFRNGGSVCYIVSIGDYQGQTVPQHTHYEPGIDALEAVDEVTLIVLADIQNLPNEANYYPLLDRALTQCQKTKDRFCIFDVLDSPARNTQDDVDQFRNGIGVNNLSYGAGYYPYLDTTLSYDYQEDSVGITGLNGLPLVMITSTNGLIITHPYTTSAISVDFKSTPNTNGSAGDLDFDINTAMDQLTIYGLETVVTGVFHTAQAVLTAWNTWILTNPNDFGLVPYGTGLDQVTVPSTNPAPLTSLTNLSLIKDTYTGAYNLIKTELAKQRVTLPPSSVMAGIYASVDRDRGVWKAPANVSITSVIGPNVQITHEQQETLNVDASSGKSINALRTFAGKGTLVWGARTLAGNDNEWRYIPVRRLFLMIEESVKDASSFAVFEPNDANTWLKVRAMIESFLFNIWQQGGLAGATADDAFFVNVGLGSTMTSQDILNGLMIVEIGIAAVRPAEFIVLRFSHKLQES